MATETSVESEYFNNPTQEQIDALNEAINENGGNASESITTESSKSAPSMESNKTSILDNKESLEQEEKPISYTNDKGETINLSVREWEDDWNKRNVDSQWQNLGRSPEDMYDVTTYLDRNGKSAWEEMSSLGVPKAIWLEELYNTDEKGNFIHQEQIDAVKEARRQSVIDEKEQNRLENKTFEDIPKLYDRFDTLQYLERTKEAPREENKDGQHRLDTWSLKNSDVKPTRDRREDYIRSPLPATGAPHGMLEEAAKNAPMLAQAGVSTNGPKYDAKNDKNLSDLIDKSINAKTGTFSKVGQKIMEGANALTLGIAPKANDITNLDKDAYRNAIIEYKQSNPNISNQDAVKYMSDLADKSSLGLAKEGIEYFLRTGDNLGNKYAVEFENKVYALTDSFVNGKISEEEYNKQMDQLADISNSKQFWSLLSSPAVSGTAGLAAGAAIGAGVAKIAEKPLSVAAKKLADVAGRYKSVGSTAIPEHPLANKIMDKIFQNNRGKIASEMFDKYKNAHQWRTEQFLKTKPGTAGSVWEGSTAVANDMVAPATVAATAATEAAKTAKENAGKAVATAAPVAVGVATNQQAEAAPTGIYDEKGKMIDSRDIVTERKETPYEGEDAVTINSREGEVTVSPREAVIIGESEGLTPDRGYTDEVKAAAKGSETYEKPEVEKIELPADEKIGFWTRVGDIIQAILGGRDINNDRTISAREWYDSTIGKVVNATKNFFSSGDKDNIDKVGEKNVFQKVGSWFKSKLDAIGNSVPGVVDLKNNTAYINPAYNKPNLSKEEVAGAIKNGIENALPSWSDSAKKDLANEAVLGLGDVTAFGPITLAKAVGSYVTATVDEIYWTQSGNRMTPDEKAALNFVVTNAVGLPLAPVSTVVRDVKEGAGLYNRGKIENVFSGENQTYIIPFDEDNSVNEEEFDEKKKRSIDELEEVTPEGNKQESLSGINLPALSEEDLDWIIRRPEMKNYNYGRKQ